MSLAAAEAAVEAGAGQPAGMQAMEVEQPAAGERQSSGAVQAGGERARARTVSGTVSCQEPLPGDMGSFAFAQQAGIGLGEPLPTQKQGLSFNEAVVTIIINATGVALVLFPKIMADIGMGLAPLLCAVCALTCVECGIMICGGCKIAENMLGISCITNYEKLAETVGGGVAKKFLTVTKNFALLGTITAYIQLVCDSIGSFLPGTLADKPMLTIRFCVALPAFGLLAMLTDLTQLAKLSGVGIGAVIVECGSIIAGGLALYLSSPSCETDPSGCIQLSMTPTVPNEMLPGRCGKYLAIFLFSYAILAMVPSLRSELADPSQMHAILTRSFSILVVSNCTVMFLGYIGFGKNTPDNIMIGIAEQFPMLGMVASTSIIVNVLISAPLNIFCIVTAFEASGSSPIHMPLSPANVTFRIGLIFAICCVGATLPYIAEIIACVASIFACCNNILFPMIFHWYGRQQAGVVPQNPYWRQVKYICSLMVGCIVLVFGFSSSVQDLMKKIRQANKVAFS